MAVIGSGQLIRRGYSHQQVAALHEISQQLGRNVVISENGGRTSLKWDYPITGPHQSFHQQVGIKSAWKGEPGEWEVYEPTYSKTMLTESERFYPLPVYRPESEKISFNPFQLPIQKGQAAIGKITQPGGREQFFTVKGFTKTELEKALKKAIRGETVEVERRYPEYVTPSHIIGRLELGRPLPPKPIRQSGNFSNFFKRMFGRRWIP